MPSLAEIIESAKTGSAIQPPKGNHLLMVSIEGTPSYKMTNAVAGFQSEIEDLFLRTSRIVGGGHGNAFGQASGLCVHIDTGRLTEADASQLKSFVETPANANYFRQRYGVSRIAVTFEADS